jgi:hypothetical protein
MVDATVVWLPAAEMLDATLDLRAEGEWWGFQSSTTSHDNSEITDVSSSIRWNSATLPIPKVVGVSAAVGFGADEGRTNEAGADDGGVNEAPGGDLFDAA